MSVGIVLSGGGARGDFQVGAVRYLYERNIRPAVLTGCSVGAINAIKLAEGEGDGNDSNRGYRGLIKIWSELNSNNDMWKEEQWLTNIKNSKVAAFLKQSADSQFGTAALEMGKLFLGPIGWVWVARDLAQTVKDLEEFKSELDKVVNARSRSLYNLGPIQAKMYDPSKLDLSKIQKSGIKLRLAAVALESGNLRYVTETGEIVERDNTTRVHAPTLLAPECQSIAGKIKDLKSERDGLQEEMKKAVGSGKAAIGARIRRINVEIIQLNNQLRTCNAAHPTPSNPLRVDLIQGTLASASIPLAFPPVKLGNENYVDGGVREILPIQAAIQEGATDVYAIIASDSTVDAARSVVSGKLLPSFDVGVANIVDVAGRAANDIMTNETVLNETEPPLGWGVNVTIIQPNFDIRDIMTIDPGLIDIRMAHGYMRADDTLQAKKQNQADYLRIADEFADLRRTSLIVQTRQAIWEREYAANGFLLKYDDNNRPVHPAPTIKPDPQALLEVRSLKNTLKDLVRERQDAGGAVPNEAKNWWDDWERHPWKPTRSLWSDPAATGNDMQPGEVLEIDQPINSANGVYTFIFQGDGNLVLYKNSKVTGLAAECRPIEAKINSLKNERTGLQEELKEAVGSGKAAIAARILKINSEITQYGNQLRDCNIVHPPQTTVKREPIWASGTVGKMKVCIMQTDGNLVIYDTLNQPRWSSNTWQHPGSRLVVQDDGNVVIYRPDGKPVWATKG
ncbi:patatin-like phospholipase family protein [Neobacillus mesonae]|uniref:patatin-like phospholipase family protein n=1 Tax=Neobacillus mesonae TaxID=1193713 RepID=UPI0008311C06|nr:patatin-like phospholipase family protein [Neobacillus mesonae]